VFWYSRLHLDTLDNTRNKDKICYFRYFRLYQDTFDNKEKRREPMLCSGIPMNIRVTLQHISKNSSFRQKPAGFPDASDGSDGSSYPLTGPSLLDLYSGLQVHLGAPGSIMNHCRAVWEKHLLWECCWCAWIS